MATDIYTTLGTPERSSLPQSSIHPSTPQRFTLAEPEPSSEASRANSTGTAIRHVHRNSVGMTLTPSRSREASSKSVLQPYQNTSSNYRFEVMQDCPLHGMSGNTGSIDNRSPSEPGLTSGIVLPSVTKGFSRGQYVTKLGTPKQELEIGEAPREHTRARLAWLKKFFRKK